MGHILRLLMGVAFLIVPGLALAPLVARLGFPRRQRPLVAMAVGPIAAAGGMAVLRFASLPAYEASLIVFGSGLAALLWHAIAGGWGTLRPATWSVSEARTGTATLVTLLAILLPIVWLGAFWAASPGYRTFNWHALMQIDVCNAIRRGPMPIEEPEMAGLVCSYSWLINCFWVGQSEIAGLPPTVFLPINNILECVLLVLLCHALARRLHLGRNLASLSVAITLFGTNLARVLLLDFRPGLVSKEMLGDNRCTTLLGKYTNLDTMPYAFSALAALLLILTRHPPLSTAGRIAFAASLFVTSAAAILAYPLLLPVIGLIVVAWAGILWFGHPHGNHLRQRRLAAIAGAAAFAPAAAIGLAFVEVLKVDRATTGVIWHVLERGSVTANASALVGIGPLIALGAIAVAPGLWTRREGIGILAVGACAAFAGFLLSASSHPEAWFFAWWWIACLIVAFHGLKSSRPALVILWWGGVGAYWSHIALDIVGLQYKFLLVGTILLSPAAAAGIGSLTSRLPRLRAGVVWLGPIALAAVMYRECGSSRIPSNLKNRPSVVETSAVLHLDPGEEEAGWIRSVSERAPLDAIVVSRGDRIHAAAFVDRSLYVSSDPGVSSAGYSLGTRKNMTVYRGHAVALFDERVETVRSLFESPEERADALRDIRSSNRPLVIHLQPEGGADAELMRWLVESEAGELLFDDGKHAAFLIERAAKETDFRRRADEGIFPILHK